MQDPDTTFDQLKALRLVCRSLDAICSRRVLTSIRLFGNGSRYVLENFHQFNGVMSCKRLSSATTLVIPNWRWIHGDENFLSFRASPGPGGVTTVILLNTFVVPFIHLYRFILSPSILPVGVFHSAIRLGAKLRLAFRNEIGFSNIRRVE